MDCDRCLKVHGPGCAASFTRAGQALCVFCADGIVCPTQRKIAAMPLAERTQFFLDHMLMEIKRSQQEAPMMTTANGSITAAAPTAAKPETETAPASRACAHPGCKARLSVNNTSGKCQKHRSHTAKPKTNGAAPPMVMTQANGHANGHALTLLEERVELVLQAIPPEEKARMVTAWLSGH